MDPEKVEFISTWPPTAEHVPTSLITVSCSKIKRSTDRAVENDVCIKPKKTAKLTPLNGERPDSGIISVGEEGYGSAQAEIAKWWRHCSQSKESVQISLPDDCKAKSAVSYIARTPEGKHFLMSKIKKLKEVLESKTDRPIDNLLFCLGTFYDLLGKYENAAECFTRSLQEGNGSSENKWYLAKCQKNLEIISRQKLALKSLYPGNVIAPVKVEKRDCSTLSAEEFHHCYEKMKKPVVITGLLDEINMTSWSLDYIKERIGQHHCPLKFRAEWSREWAKLESIGKVSTVSDFIDSFGKKEGLNSYLFDWSLPLFAPQLVKDIRIPKYFARDFLQKTEPGTIYRDSWPSLFVAPKGMVSDLHIDAFQSNFWMVLIEGRKKWTFFPEEDFHLLYPTFESSMNAQFDVDIKSLDFSEHPLSAFARRTECVLEPGEVLFVPHGCPHHVENLTDSLALSSNFIDSSNLHDSISALTVDGLVDPGAHHLREQLLRFIDNTDTEFLNDHVDWQVFKGR